MSAISFRKSSFFRYIAFTVLAAFIGVLPVQTGFAQVTIVMPPIGQMIHVTSHFEPPQMVGLKINLKDPFSFGFIMDQGQSPMSDSVKKEEFNKIIKYFLVSLAMPNKDMWVNLSPFESKRIIPEIFGQTEMGRDLLAQDYVLKQFTASLMYPEDGLGKQFWNKVYEEGQARFGTTDINVNTFNKVWIVADHADVYQKGDTAFLVGSHLKVMLEQDFKAIEQNKEQFGEVDAADNNSNDAKTQMASQLVREIIIPAIEKEVNEGQSFAAVRQIYNAEIMATWFKKTLKESLLGQVFADKAKIAGQKVSDPQAREKIFQQYLLAYKQGVFNFIKQETMPDGQVIPRRYLSGGMEQVNQAMVNTITPQEVNNSPSPSEVAINEQALTNQLSNVPSQEPQAEEGLIAQQFNSTPNFSENNLKDMIKKIANSAQLSSQNRADIIASLAAKITPNTQHIDTQGLAAKLNVVLDRAHTLADVMSALEGYVPNNTREPVAPDVVAGAIAADMPQLKPSDAAQLVVGIKNLPKEEIAQEIDNTGRDLAVKARDKSLDLAQVSLASAPAQPAAVATPMPSMTPMQIAETTSTEKLLDTLARMEELSTEKRADLAARVLLQGTPSAQQQETVLQVAEKLRNMLDKNPKSTEWAAQVMTAPNILPIPIPDMTNMEGLLTTIADLKGSIANARADIAAKFLLQGATPAQQQAAVPQVSAALGTMLVANPDPAAWAAKVMAAPNIIPEAPNSTTTGPVKDLGGINLSNEHLTMNVKVDGAGMPLPPQYQDKALLNLNGLVSIICSITPITPQNLPALYELTK